MSVSSLPLQIAIHHFRRLALAAAVVGACVMPASAADAVGGDHVSTSEGDLVIHPVNHATLVMTWNGHAIYVDPVGEADRYAGLPEPDLVLITDIHGDHLSTSTLAAIVAESTQLVAPEAVAEKLPDALREKTTVLANGESGLVDGANIEAIPMYNLTPDRLKYHTKGRGNGYVLTLGGTRVYLSGDTEDIPEMRALKGIDVAFVCMNLPYTMTVEQAADAVKAFAPKMVYPYHYRGSDVEKFKELVSVRDGIEVRLRDWY